MTLNPLKVQNLKTRRSYPKFLSTSWNFEQIHRTPKDGRVLRSVIYTIKWLCGDCQVLSELRSFLICLFRVFSSFSSCDSMFCRGTVGWLACFRAIDYSSIALCHCDIIRSFLALVGLLWDSSLNQEKVFQNSSPSIRTGDFLTYEFERNKVK